MFWFGVISMLFKFFSGIPSNDPDRLEAGLKVNIYFYIYHVIYHAGT